MIPLDMIERVVVAHNLAVKSAQRWERCTPGTRRKENAYERFVNAENKFDSAMANLVDAANKRILK